ncbi:CRISPR-associated helicase/endonuclease Cas3 [Spirosoma montaniterrae]|uniref:CRISPR-associated protein Cas3 n=1 Tax=Spirosoma montaniterrae TaxID=1178516 RepID=A0A1P9X4I9_9BACT|nr:CRISPR-associated helicase/endonuclease Cas3 [Spirosoma montaniterrae]AQG82505.1 CRISPR-associated protein Cas3 [Spirosoma montaniterrae]
MIDHLLAKTKDRESLSTHTDLVLGAWQELHTRYAAVLEEDESFWFDAFIAALFHDFGKASLNFQNMLRKELGESISENGYEPMRHEFLSGVLLAAHTMLKARSRQDIQPNPAQVFAVFTHHKDFTLDLFCKDADKQWKIRPSDADAFFAYASQRLGMYYSEKGAFLNDIETTWQFIEDKPASSLLMLKDHVVQSTLADLEEKRNYVYRKTYLLQKALLMIADWTASGHRKLETTLAYDVELIRQKIVERVAKAGGTFSGFREFQERSGQLSGNVLAIAPTGSGKTEAALLWATQREGYEKIVYLLPTRVTANALFKRLDSFFGYTADKKPERFTAVVHSSAKLFRLDLDENYENLNYLRESAFFKAVTVATVDQMLTQGFNLGWWEMKTFHLFRARVILDEIHAYAPYTLGLIVATIRYLRANFQTQFYVMTATMPQKLQVLLARELGIGDDKILRDQQLLDKKRNTFYTTEKTIDQLRPNVEADLREGKKVLIVVNTVDEAIRLYDQYASVKNRMCYHSRFIVKHRTEKERLILENEEKAPNQGFLLIATQVVEVSLDIDYQSLYTENAPIDAIIQRAGRINRKRSETLGKVVIFPHSETTEKHVYDEPQGILKKTFDELEKRKGTDLSEQDLLDLVEVVYDGWNVEADKQYIDALTKYERLLKKHCAYLYDFSGDLEQVFTREGLDTVNVIPNCYQIELANASILEKSKHEVAIRNHRFKSGRKEKDMKHSWFQYFDCDYSFEKGLRYKAKENHAGTTHHH